MKKFKIVKAYKVTNRMSRGIFELPCVMSAVKSTEGVIYDLDFTKLCMYEFVSAREGYWLCQREDGMWFVCTNEEYKELYAPISK